MYIYIFKCIYVFKQHISQKKMRGWGDTRKGWQRGGDGGGGGRRYRASPGRYIHIYRSYIFIYIYIAAIYIYIYVHT